MTYTFPQLLMLFFIYGFIGWCVEVAFAAIKSGHFVNRGFLNGPICPIYGVGIVGVVVLLEPFNDSLVILYVGSVVVTTVIEFITGFLLEKLFHARWWDYSKMKFNIMGYVSPLMSLVWGVVCVFVVRLIHPLIYGVILLLPIVILIVLVCLFSAVLVVDLLATVITINKLNKHLKRLTEMAAEIHAVSDEIGQSISDTALVAKDKAMAGGEKLEESKRKLDEIKTETGERLNESKRAVTEQIDENKRMVREHIDEGKRNVAEHIDEGKRNVAEHIDESKRNVQEQIEEGKRARTERSEQNRLAMEKQMERNRENVAERLEENKRRLESLKERFASSLDEHNFGQNRLLSAFPHLTSENHQEALSALRENYEQKRRSKKKKKNSADGGNAPEEE